VGTDCSGIEAPLYALQHLGVPITHEFSCDSDPHVKASILANHRPRMFFDDIRAPRELPPLDLYVAGFPCQPFSCVGQRRGLEDERADIAPICVEAITRTNPKVFLLENVKSFKTMQGGKCFGALMDLLEPLRATYEIEHAVLDTKDYGPPQSRNRLYIVGIKRSAMVQAFAWPLPTPMRPITEYVDYSNTQSEPLDAEKLEFFAETGAVFFDLTLWGFRESRRPPVIFPCVKTRGNVWFAPLQRRLTARELLNFQGFPASFKQVVSDTQTKKQAGNSMTVDVVAAVLRECLKAIGGDATT